MATLFSGPALAGDVATCFYDTTGAYSGRDWGNLSRDRNLEVGQSERQSFQGNYAFVYIVDRVDSQVTCPQSLTVPCNDCAPGDPVWETESD
jgi:hypothetical protein